MIFIIRYIVNNNLNKLYLHPFFSLMGFWGFGEVEKNISGLQTMASHDIEPSVSVAVCEGHAVQLADLGEGLI